MIISGIILVILLLGDFFGYNFLFAPRVVSENSYKVLSCSDTDGKNIHVKGYTNYERDEPKESSLYESPNYCEKHPKYGTVLREEWCKGNTYIKLEQLVGVVLVV
ncbi:MAG: hypothetical protein OQK82_03005 [Candidatus Pacearchaeota archaeon]|nr:hypothetical protein [Candidatus Pacearchaeota archaeon]